MADDIQMESERDWTCLHCGCLSPRIAQRCVNCFRSFLEAAAGSIPVPTSPAHEHPISPAQSSYTQGTFHPADATDRLVCRITEQIARWLYMASVAAQAASQDRFPNWDTLSALEQTRYRSAAQVAVLRLVVTEELRAESRMLERVVTDLVGKHGGDCEPGFLAEVVTETASLAVSELEVMLERGWRERFPVRRTGWQKAGL